MSCWQQNREKRSALKKSNNTSKSCLNNFVPYRCGRLYYLPVEFCLWTRSLSDLDPLLRLRLLENTGGISPNAEQHTCTRPVRVESGYFQSVSMYGSLTFPSYLILEVCSLKHLFASQLMRNIYELQPESKIVQFIKAIYNDH